MSDRSGRHDGGLGTWCRLVLDIVDPADVLDLASDGAVAGIMLALGGPPVVAVVPGGGGSSGGSVVSSVHEMDPARRFDCCVVLGGLELGDVESARRVVAEAASRSDIVVFCAPLPLDHPLGRWPTFWDALFAERGAVPVDPIRAALWDDPEVDPVYSQATTVYVAVGALDRAGRWPTSALPRAVVHPARHAQALRSTVARSVVDGLASELAAARQRGAEAEVMLDQAAIDLDAVSARAETLEAQVEKLVVAAEASPVAAVPPTVAEPGRRRRRVHAVPLFPAAASRELVRWGGTRRAVPDVAAAMPTVDDQVAALVDSRYYLERYREVGPSGIAPRQHFAKYGLAEHRDPCRWFDTAYYLASNPDVASSSIPPLLHYVTTGWREGRDPHPWFSGRHYLAQNLDVAAAGVNPLVHFVVTGMREGRSPHLLLDPDTCARQAATLGVTVADPCAWWIGGAWLRGASPHWLFSVPWYAHRGPDVAAAGVDPLRHYVDHGWKELRSPHPLFDPDWYLSVYPDVARAGSEPLTHYLESGRFEVRRPGPLFDPIWYRVEAGAAALGPDEPCEHYLRVGRAHGLVPSRWAADLHASVSSS